MEWQEIAFSIHNSVLFFTFLFMAISLFIAVYILEPAYYRLLFTSVTNSNSLILNRREGLFDYTLRSAIVDTASLTVLILSLHYFFFSDKSVLFSILFVLIAFPAYFILLSLGTFLFFDENTLVVQNDLFLSIFRLLSLALVLILFVSVYSDKMLFPATKTAVILLLGLSSIILPLRSLFQINRLMGYGLYFNFVYICTVQIAPVIVGIFVISSA